MAEMNYLSPQVFLTLKPLYHMTLSRGLEVLNIKRPGGYPLGILNIVTLLSIDSGGAKGMNLDERKSKYSTFASLNFGEGV